MSDRGSNGSNVRKQANGWKILQGLNWKLRKPRKKEHFGRPNNNQRTWKGVNALESRLDELEKRESFLTLPKFPVLAPEHRFKHAHNHRYF